MDDLVIFGKDTTNIDKFKKVLSHNIVMIDSVYATQTLRIKVDWSLPNDVELRQTTVIETLPVTHGVNNIRLVGTPIRPAGLEWNYDMPLDIENTNKYSSIVGRLLYLSVKTRPDIAVAKSMLGSFVA